MQETCDEFNFLGIKVWVRKGNPKALTDSEERAGAIVILEDDWRGASQKLDRLRFVYALFHLLLLLLLLLGIVIVWRWLIAVLVRRHRGRVYERCHLVVSCVTWWWWEEGVKSTDEERSTFSRKRGIKNKNWRFRFGERKRESVIERIRETKRAGQLGNKGWGWQWSQY